MTATLLVAAGGAIGSVARFWTGLLMVRIAGDGFPYGTLIVNVVGSAIIGAFATVPASAETRLFVMTGLCGGFTTFSAFSLQTVALARADGLFPAALNVAASVLLCLGSTILGHTAAQRLGPPP